MPTYTVGTGKTYSTIQGAVDAIPGDLSAGGVQTVEVYQNGTWDGTVCYYNEMVDTLTGFTNQGASDYIRVVAMEKNNGQRDQGIVIRPTGTSGTLSIVTPGAYTRIEGFGLTITNVSYANYIQGIAGNGISNLFISGIIIFDLYATANRIYGMLIGADCIVRNCAFIYLRTTSNYSVGVYSSAGSGTSYAQFCSAVNLYREGASDAYRVGFWSVTGTMENRNCIVVDCKFLDSATMTNYNCASEDGSADDHGGSGNLVLQDPDTDMYLTDSGQGTEDIHISSESSSLFGAGIAVSGVTTDIDGDTRDDPPDIGADELFSPVVGPKMDYYRRRRIA